MIYNVGSGCKTVIQGWDNSVTVSSGGFSQPQILPLGYEAHRRQAAKGLMQERVKSFCF